jgi:phytoene dehydrogenase-like protein
VTKVVLESGEEIEASAVISGLTPARTLLELMDPGLLDPTIVRAVRNIRARGVSAQISLKLDRDPGFTTLVIAPSLDYLERAYDDVKYGRASSAPYIEARHLGTTAAARHHVQVHGQFLPRVAADAEWDTRAAESLGRAIVARLAQHVPGLTDSVVEQHVLTPSDMEHVHGFPEGQPYHAELALDQVLWMRPAPALAQYRTPIEGLYLCGPAMHPGGGIAGAAGANAASVVLRDLKKRKE